MAKYYPASDFLTLDHIRRIKNISYEHEKNSGGSYVPKSVKVEYTSPESWEDIFNGE